MRNQIIILFVLLLLPAKGMADIVVIVNSANQVTELSQRQVIDLYMGRTSYFPNGGKLQRYDQPSNSTVRADFYYRITRKSVAAINAFWARLIFTGRASPPRVVADDIEMLEIVEKNPEAIGYIAKEYLNDRVTVVLEIKAH